MRTLHLLALVVLASACRDSLPDQKIDEPDTLDTVDTRPDTDIATVDADGDGVPDDEDCAPDDASVSPTATEVPYDGVDNDCDPATLDDDLDQDGFGAGADCDDADALVNPDAIEACNELDDDCNGLVDDAVGGTWFLDLDGDGFGDPDTEAMSCEPGSDQVADANDCDDARAEAFPGADELCNELDDDCDGQIDDNPVDGIIIFRDADDDGFGDAAIAELSCELPGGWSGVAGDCDDAAGDRYPDAPERCDGIDQDCDAVVDNDAVDAPTWYADDDGDGFGDLDAPALACEAPAGTVSDATDCDDSSATTNPGAIELCNGVDDDCNTLLDDGATDTITVYEDVDGDGFGDPDAASAACTPPPGTVLDDTDCDDAIPSIFPGAPELCDGLDNDCNGAADDDTSLLATWYADDDGDGFGRTADTQTSCEAPAGYTAAPGDCDDALDTVFPGADERCDGIDEDCDGRIDDDPIDPETWYLDFDGDGFGGATFTQLACEAPAGWLASADDCDDGRAIAFPGADELCNGLDEDCDGTADNDPIDPATWFLDGDGDGFGDEETTVAACTLPPGASATAGDCDDSTAAINPAAIELCNGLDDDCANGTDGTDAADASTWWRDQDGDGYGDTDRTTQSCALPAGYIDNEDDCDDRAAAVFPGNAELCDGLDNDCNSLIDDGATDAQTWYADVDDDGFGDAASALNTCTPPAAHVRNDRDCDDGNAAVFPGAAEVCNGLDDDCSGDADSDAVDRSTFWTDADADGWGTDSTPILACTMPAGSAARSGDCNDAIAAVFPGATETCDGLDGDCDGEVDSPPPASAPSWNLDADGDGFGTTAFSLAACEAPTGFVADTTDCNDSEATAYPGNPEICDGIDNDCNAAIDDGATGSVTWYLDGDGDGAGNPTATVTTCSPPTGYVTGGDDCDDANAAVSPFATEVCNGLDDNCDSIVDTDAVDRTDFWLDADADGFGDTTQPTPACAQPPGAAAVAGDCNDSDDSIRPDADEACDGVDRDCDGTIDGPDPVGAPLSWVDADGDGYGNPAFSLAACTAPDGYVTNDEDCDDLRPATFPGADETCDGTDEDCDGETDELGAIDAPTWFADADGDTWGNPADTTEACAVPSGFVGNEDDCNDTDGAINPDADEQCDDVDHNCDGDPSFGTAGANAVCAAASCLDVLERGMPTESDWFWLEGAGLPYEEYCDFGTVADGWDWRSPLSITHGGTDALEDVWVPVAVDVGLLTGAGKLQPRAEDFRIFTLDGPLLRYWVDLPHNDTVAEVWMNVEDLPAGGLDLVVAYGNPDTERKSIAWSYDPFDVTVTSPYTTVSAWSSMPGWTWDLGRSAVTTDGTNGDYLLQADTELSLPVYIETRARTFDDDGVGVMLRKAGGGFIAAAVTDDYAGVQNSSDGLDGISNFDTLPTGHRLGTWLLNAGNVASASTEQRVGLYYDGMGLDFYVNGNLVSSVLASSLDLTAGGLVSFANTGSPGAAYEYLWMGSEPIGFDPELLSSPATGALGAESAFQ